MFRFLWVAACVSALLITPVKAETLPDDWIVQALQMSEDLGDIMGELLRSKCEISDSSCVKEHERLTNETFNIEGRIFFVLSVRDTLVTLAQIPSSPLSSTEEAKLREIVSLCSSLWEPLPTRVTTLKTDVGQFAAKYSLQ